MELSKEQKQRIINAIKENRKNYPSDIKHAAALGINKSVYSELMTGKTERLLAAANFLSIARKLNVSLRDHIAWRAAETPVFVYISEQLEMCRQSSLSGLLCDIPNIGKTFTAKHYAASHKNTVYVDCGQVKTKMRMIRSIAREFGLSDNGRYADVYDELVYYLKSIDRPLSILDEAGDINPETFLELKALWNATDRTCGWYMMGANGLKAKIQRNRAADTLGYEEMFSRYGGRYGRVTPEEEKERRGFLKAQAVIIARINAPQGVDAEMLARSSEGELRRLYTEIEKITLPE
jgi:transcriptional regulator with XRE-family HTH domain